MPNALECEFAKRIPGTEELEESLAVVPLRYGSRVTGAIVISKLGINQFDEDDVRLLEVLAGQASVALENARLYEQQRREAEGAKALLAFADEVSQRAVVRRDLHADRRDGRGAVRDRSAPRSGSDDDAAAASQRRRADRRAGIDGRPLRRGRRRPRTGSCSMRRRTLDERRRARLLASFALPGVGRAAEGAALLAAARGRRDRERAARREPRARDRRVARRGARAQRRGDRARARDRRAPRSGSRRRHEPHDLVARASFGYTADDDPVGRPPLPGRARARVARAHRAVRARARQISRDRRRARRAQIARFVVAPLRLEGGRVGALTATIGDRVLDDRQLRLLAGLAHQAKLAIESAEHYESLERTFVSTVAALANALEANDEYTSSHARWITDMSLLVGRELRLDRDAMKRLELGALFHDIGKIGIPSEILQKPGPLTDEEFEIVKEHPELGEKILAPIERLADVRPIVRACHERWDGLGYPDGKAGAEIPIEARIVLVCDAFHAMVTDRPYRGRLPDEEAVRRLRESAGTQFDPTVVEAFVRLFDSGAVLAV